MEEPYKLLSMGVAKSRTWLSNFTFTFTRGWQTLSLEDWRVCILGFCRPRNNSVALLLLTFFFFLKKSAKWNSDLLLNNIVSQTHQTGPKIEGNFRDEKKKKRTFLSLAFLAISDKLTTYCTVKYTHKMLRIKLFCYCFFCFFFTRCFSPLRS